VEHDIKTTRRGFLVRLSALGAGSAVCLGSPGLLGPEPVAADNSQFLATVSCGDFRRHLWTNFRLHPETGSPVDVELIQAREQPARGPRSQPGMIPVTRTPFSLLFRSGSAPGLPQRTYRVEHGQLGGFDLFLVRINPDRLGRVRYEAIFG